MTAIVDRTPGVTRDRKYVEAQWGGKDFTIADTGGVGIDTSAPFAVEIERQAFFAAEGADLLVMVVDARTGVTEDDQWLARKLQRLGSEVLLVANKVDSPEREPDASVFYELALGAPLAVSAQHGLGVGDLLDRIVELLPDSPPEEEEGSEEIAIAIVGRPNVGKSSILNRLVGHERAVVHHQPHTTRDAIESCIESEGKRYRIVDTAGIRKSRTSMSDIEYYSSIRTFRAIEDADVVLLVIDGKEGPTEHDQRLASKIEARGRACIVLINKWDLVAEEGNAPEVLEAISFKFRFARHLPLLRVSALTGRGFDRILPLVETVFMEWNRRIPTAKLNALLEEYRVKESAPSKGGRQLRIYYATQADVAPPTLVFFVNDAGLVKSNYRRFLTNRIREEYGFWGAPLRIFFQTAKGGTRSGSSHP